MKYLHHHQPHGAVGSVWGSPQRPVAAPAAAAGHRRRAKASGWLKE